VDCVTGHSLRWTPAAELPGGDDCPAHNKRQLDTC
jgi:hypothetical protein